MNRNEEGTRQANPNSNERSDNEIERANTPRRELAPEKIAELRAASTRPEASLGIPSEVQADDYWTAFTAYDVPDAQLNTIFQHAQDEDANESAPQGRQPQPLQK